LTPRPTFDFFAVRGTKSVSQTFCRLVPESFSPTVASLTVSSVKGVLLFDLMNCSQRIREGRHLVRAGRDWNEGDWTDLKRIETASNIATRHLCELVETSRIGSEVLGLANVFETVDEDGCWRLVEADDASEWAEWSKRGGVASIPTNETKGLVGGRVD
jgi:hypothetical protein